MALGACTSADVAARARRDDAAHRTGVFTWAYDHDPARIDVWGVSAAAIDAYLRDGRARAVGGSVSGACRTAARDRALLLVVAPVGSTARALAGDCGFALVRDGFALVVAPR